MIGNLIQVDKLARDRLISGPGQVDKLARYFILRFFNLVLSNLIGQFEFVIVELIFLWH